MAQPVLKSIHPVNLLSFGPKTEPIELRSLNILIGANGSGKSNLIEVIRLLHLLPDKDPWRSVLRTGGVEEWIWKGIARNNASSSLSAEVELPDSYDQRVIGYPDLIRFELDLSSHNSTFHVIREKALILVDKSGELSFFESYSRLGLHGMIQKTNELATDTRHKFDLTADRSILSQLASRSVQASGVGGILPELSGLADLLEKFDFHQVWEFGDGCVARTLQDVGRPVDRLLAGGYNLAQMLKYFQDFHKPVFDQLLELTKKFYEPTQAIKIQLISTHLQVAIEEEGGNTTPASRLSDGMLRWLSLLCVLLNPTPAPVTCIDEPELGLHPDVIPTLADLLKDAAKRTQLIVTTHSAELVDEFTNDPEAVCVCEKVDGSTVIRRLSQANLRVWLESYSLENLWKSGQIGGNRW